jgi:hypothetical protein
MRRPARGATARPPHARPGAAYGRPLRAGPPVSWREYDLFAQTRPRDPAQLLSEPVDATQHA